MKSIANIIHKKILPLKIIDSDGNIIYFERQSGFWWKQKYDSNGNVIYYENSAGTIRDNR